MMILFRAVVIVVNSNKLPINTIKPVLRGHPRDEEKVAL